MIEILLPLIVAFLIVKIIWEFWEKHKKNKTEIEERSNG